jgi:UMF1 family MFS transporter
MDKHMEYTFSETTAVDSPSSPPERAEQAISEHESNRTLQQNSESLTQQEESTSQSACYPSCCGHPVFGGNGEALGWCLDVVGRTVSIIAIGAFLFPALVTLANEAAGCPADPSVECNERVYGIKPSSLLTTVHTIVGVCTAPLLPLMGAMVDYGSHRLLVGRILSMSFLALLFPQIFVSETTWFALAIVLVVLFFVFIFQMVAAYAYLPELTTKEDKLNSYTRNFTVITFLVVVIYIAAIVGVTGGLGIANDFVLVARIAVSSVFCIAAIALSLAWGVLFQNRPPLHELPPDKSIWTAGFSKVYCTIKKIWADYRALKWFYLAVAFCDGAIEALMTILISFATDVLEFSSMEIGVSVLLMLLANIPGGFLAAWITKCLDPRWSQILSVVLIITMTSLCAGLLSGPGQQTLAYILIFFWGLGIGWKWTTDRMLSAAIIPKEQNAEYMGIYLFFGAILTWAPPLIYTALNEGGVSQQIGLASLNIFFVIGLFAYWMMGSYRDAVQVVEGVFAHSDESQPSTPNLA